MIDFDQMVRNVLWEEVDQNLGGVDGRGNPPNPPPATNQQTVTTSPTGTNVSEEEEIKQNSDSIYKWLTSTSTFKDLETQWIKFKGGYKICSDTELNTLCHTVVSFKPRSTKSPEKFLNIQNIFPLIDLIANLYEQNFKGKSKGNPDDAKNTYITFVKELDKQFKTNPNLKPLDYIAIDPWAQSIKSAYLSMSKNELGKLRLEDQKDETTIYNLIFNFLAIRKKLMFPKLSQGLKMANGQAIVDKIMLEPWTLVSGSFAINDETLRNLYDSTTVQETVDLSLSVYKLFKQQQEAITGVIENKTPPDSKLYNSFIGKGGTGEVTWPTKPTKPAPAADTTPPDTTPAPESAAPPNITPAPGVAGLTTQTASFDQSYELFTRSLLREVIYESDDTEIENSETKPTTPTAKAFETGPETGKFVYNYGTIKAASTSYKIEEASNLIKELQDFANYIKTKEGKDIMGGLNKMIQGMSLGVKNMGS